MTYRLRLTSQIFERDSNSLVDYHQDFLLESKISTKISGYLMRENKDILLRTELAIQKNKNYILTYVIKNNTHFILIEKDFYHINEHNVCKTESDNWIMLHNTYSKNNRGYKLREFDIIRFGKIIFKIKEISTSFKIPVKSTTKNINTNILNILTVADGKNNSHSNNILSHNNITPSKKDLATKNLSQSNNINNDLTEASVIQVNHNTDNNQSIFSKAHDTPNHLIKKKSSDSRKNICRICLGDHSEEALLNICKCIGSVKYIHLKCLRKWVYSKIIVKCFNHLTVYSYKTIECDICKQALPEKIKVSEVLTNLIDPNELSDPKSENKSEYNNYITLECINDIKLNSEDENIKLIYIINLKNKNVLKLGRSMDSDILMSDISVSRNHAEIRLYNDGIFLYDCNSKFGTLVNYELNSQMLLLPRKKLSMQMGINYITFYLEKSCFDYFCKDLFFRGNKDSPNPVDYSECRDNQKLNQIVEANLEKESSNNEDFDKDNDNDNKMINEIEFPNKEDYENEFANVTDNNLNNSSILNLNVTTDKKGISNGIEIISETNKIITVKKIIPKRQLTVELKKQNTKDDVSLKKGKTNDYFKSRFEKDYKKDKIDIL